MTSDTREARMELLTEFAQIVKHNAQNGAIMDGRPVYVGRCDLICGPRAGALEMLVAGSGQANVGAFMSKLRVNQAAILRQLIPQGWQFVGKPTAFMSGRHVRLEAGWPRALQDTCIRLSELGQCPTDRYNRWTVGMDDRGRRVSTALKVDTPHFLFSGLTQSGKSTGILCALIQLCRGGNQVVLCDGKRGQGLNPAAHWSGVVGPVATDLETIRGALGWAYNQMEQRYDQMKQGWEPDSRIVVVFDELQEFTPDKMVAVLLRKLVSQGASAWVHVVCATQHPLVSTFGTHSGTGSTTKHQFPGKCAFLVDTAEASRVAVGGPTPRADGLLGKGDLYVVAPGVAHRVQGAYVDEWDFERAPTGQWLFDEWPVFDPADIGMRPDSKGDAWDAVETVVGLRAAIAGLGRPNMLDLFDEYDHSRPGGGRAARLLAHSRRVWALARGVPELADWCAGDRSRNR